MNVSSHAHRRAATSAKSLVSSLITTHHTTAAFHSSIHSWLLAPRTNNTSQFSSHVSSPGDDAGLRSTTTVQSGHDAIPYYAATPGLAAISARRNTQLTPRNFILACRAGSRLANATILVNGRVRHSSSTATATPASLQEDGEAIVEPNLKFTDNTNAEDAEEYVELVLRGSASGGSSSKMVNTETMTDDRIIRINGNIAAQEGSGVRASAAAISGEEPRHEVRRDLTWNHILEYLEERTHTQRLDYRHVDIQGPLHELLELYYHLLHNPRHDVDLDYPLYHYERDTGRMTIKGHLYDLELVTDYIKKQRITGLVIPYTREAATGKRILLTNTHTGTQQQDQRFRRPLVRYMAPSRRPEDVPSPRVWTISSFAKYVEDLTSARSPEVLRSGGESAQRHREDVLLDLLRSTEIRPVLSYAAFHHVLSFLTRHERHNQAWSVIELMKSLDIHPGTAFYNTMLLNAALHQDIGAFDRLLSTMQSEQAIPNAGTWVALLMASPNVEFKQIVMRKMFDNGLSAHSVFGTQTAPMIIPYSLRPFLDTGGDIDEFLDILDECWGPKWLTDDAVCHIVDVLGSRGTILEAVRLLDKLAKERAYQISKAPVHTLLKHCRRTQSVDLAVWILNYATEMWRLSVKDRVVFSTLFKIAYASQMHNMVRVAWKYAGAAGQLDSFMRSKTINSLKARCEPDRDSVNGRWISSVGAVACNLDPVAVNLSPDEIMDRERAHFETMAPRMSFTTKLVEALFLDKDWTAQQVKQTRGTTWKMMNAVTIEMKPRVRPGSRRLSLSAPRRLLKPRTVRTNGRLAVRLRRRIRQI